MTETIEQLSFGRTVCILLSGKAGVGKTTSANYLKQEYLRQGKKAEIFSFARGVKETAKFMGWDGNKDAKGRSLLQKIGAIGREYDKDCWVNKTINDIIPASKGYPYDVVIIDDFRFPNESIFVQKDPLYQVFEVRVYAPTREILKGTDAYWDVSETSLPELGTTGLDRYFSSILNLGTLDELNQRCKELTEIIYEHAVKW